MFASVINQKQKNYELLQSSKPHNKTRANFFQ